MADILSSGLPYRFVHRLRVRWAECDMQGIVFNPHYMAYVDVAFTEYMRAIGIIYPAALLAEGVDNFLVAAEQRYRDAARFDDEIDIWMRTAYFGTTSFRMEFCLARDGAALVEGSATYVTGDPASRAPKALPARLIASVEAFEVRAPDRKGARP